MTINRSLHLELTRGLESFKWLVRSRRLSYLLPDRSFEFLALLSATWKSWCQQGTCINWLYLRVQWHGKRCHTDWKITLASLIENLNSFLLLNLPLFLSFSMLLLPLSPPYASIASTLPVPPLNYLVLIHHLVSWAIICFWCWGLVCLTRIETRARCIWSRLWCVFLHFRSQSVVDQSLDSKVSLTIHLQTLPIMVLKRYNSIPDSNR